MKSAFPRNILLAVNPSIGYLSLSVEHINRAGGRQINTIFMGAESFVVMMRVFSGLFRRVALNCTAVSVFSWA
jgi:hypothetical protein